MNGIESPMGPKGLKTLNTYKFSLPVCVGACVHTCAHESKRIDGTLSHLPYVTTTAGSCKYAWLDFVLILSCGSIHLH